MLFGRRKAIEVHCWGGLGSQLFAVALIHDLNLRFPSRKSTLILHSSGVTKRAPEITILPFVTDFIVVDDYSPTDKSGGIPTGGRFIRLLLRKVIAGSGLIANANTDIEFSKIRPWVRQIRGHYSRRTIAIPFLLILDSFLKDRIERAAQSSMGVTIHYRLGDLLYLAEKSPVNDNRLAAEVLRVQKRYPGKITLFSDSPQVASGLLLRHGIDCDITSSDFGTIDVINLARTSEYFVGTSSKISYWVICLRNFGRSQISASMPSSDLPNLIPLVGIDASKQINYY